MERLYYNGSAAIVRLFLYKLGHIILILNLKRIYYLTIFCLFRSRSATPSYPGSSPQPMIPLDSASQSSQTNLVGPNKTEFQPRNYSDFIRSLAAKYNNNNPNE